jgi:hypothetical protein
MTLKGSNVNNKEMKNIKTLKACQPKRLGLNRKLKQIFNTFSVGKFIVVLLLFILNPFGIKLKKINKFLFI